MQTQQASKPRGRPRVNTPNNRRMSLQLYTSDPMFDEVQDITAATGKTLSVVLGELVREALDRRKRMQARLATQD